MSAAAVAPAGAEMECRKCGRLLDEVGRCWACAQVALAVPLNLSLTNVQDATRECIRATDELAHCGQAEAEARSALDLAEAEALILGVDGRNEAERKAALRLRLRDEYASLDAAAAAVRQARRDLDVARFWLDGLRYQLRLLEVHRAPRIGGE